MRVELDYTIEYFEKGKDLQKKVLISRINNEIAHAYSGLAKKVSGIQMMQAEAQRMIEEIGFLATEKKMGMLDRIKASKPIYKKLRELKKEIESLGNSELLKERFKVIQMILEVNGIEDDELNSFSFWNKKTEPAEAWDFLTACLTKDNPNDENKKKVE